MGSSAVPYSVKGSSHHRHGGRFDQSDQSPSLRSHYSADNHYPFVPGVDGVGRLADGHRVYFAMPETPFGAMAEQTLVDPRRIIPLPDNLDDVAAAALANPGMSCFAALIERARFKAGKTVLINGATGSAGFVAVQIAKQLGARKVIVTGRSAQELEALRALGADVVILFDLRPNLQGVGHFEKPLRTHLPTSSIRRRLPLGHERTNHHRRYCQSG